MVTTKKQRMVVDIGMVCLLPLLMAYSLIGELFHEAIGTLMMILMLVHLWQNRRWIFVIPKGRYTPRRTFQTILDLLLMMFMILQPISGILMSKHLYTFIQFPGISALIRQIHMVLAYWGFVLMSMHAGTHLMPMIRKIQKAAFPVKAATLACIAAISLYGAYVFVKRQIPEYMFMRTMFVFFDFSENRIRFLADYLAVMALFAILGLITTVVLSFLKEKKEKGDKIMAFFWNKKAISVRKDGSIKPRGRTELFGAKDEDIVRTYNSEIRGILNYYNIAGISLSLDTSFI